MKKCLVTARHPFANALVNSVDLSRGKERKKLPSRVYLNYSQPETKIATVRPATGDFKR